MFSAIIAKLLGWLGGGVIDRVLTHLEKQADSDTERLKIVEGRIRANDANQARIVMTGMQHKAFWIPWLIAAVPCAMWFGWGMLDSLCNGALPDVAALPPQLKGYADIVFGNIFFSGAGGMAVQSIATAIRLRR